MLNIGSLQRRFPLLLGLVVLALLVAACGNSSPQPATYTASGTIADDGGHPIVGVTLQFSGTTATAKTGEDGKWSRAGLKGNVTVTPVLEDYTFDPSSARVSKGSTTANFVGTSIPEVVVPGDPNDPDPEDPIPGDPEPGDTIRISTLEQLQAMRDNPDRDYILMNDIDASETRMWNDGAGFEPIGYRETPGGNVDNQPFTGSFDGNGYVIEGLYISRGGRSETGLFGRVVGGTIRNVGLVDAEVKQERSSVAGALVGYVLDGTIERSYSTGSITATDREYSVNKVGGLVGHSRRGTIADSYSTVTINVNEGAEIGGLVGNNEGGTIERSYSAGEVEGGTKVGGLVGYNHSDTGGTEDGIIKDSYSLSPASGAQHVGGLVGWNKDGEIYTSYSTGRVSGSRFTGGLVGYGAQREGVVEDAYWDKEQSRNSTWRDMGTGLTTAEMKFGAPFSEAWKPSVWSFPAGEYPQLVDNPREVED